MEKQIVLDVGDVIGIYYECPGCKRECFMDRKALEDYYDGNWQVCFPCKGDNKNSAMLEARFEGEFRYLAGVLCSLTEFKGMNLRFAGSMLSETEPES